MVNLSQEGYEKFILTLINRISKVIVQCSKGSYNENIT